METSKLLDNVPLKVVLLILIFAFFPSCVDKYTTTSGSLERRYSIKRCKQKVPVIDDDPGVLINQYIDEKKGIWLFPPIVELNTDLKTDDQDSIYFKRVRRDLEKSIANKFLLDKWVVDLRGEENFYNGMKTSILDSLVKRATQGSINYSQWDVDESLVDPSYKHYSMIVYIKGLVGDRANTGAYVNELYFFVIDNFEKKVSYSDAILFNCDVRNLDSINKLLEYAFRKLVDVRFREKSIDG
ncbi:MAG: hypothetical protein ACJAXB_001490 [Candidatus Endobugula sp.]|jgi:hypothetical protein